MPENKIQIIIEAVDKTKEALRDMESNMKGTLSKLKENWLALSAAIAGALIAINRAWHLAEQSAEFEDQKARLNSLAATYDTTADSIIGDIQRITSGQIAMANIVDVTTQALSKNMKLDVLKDLAQYADAVGDTMKTSTAEGFRMLIQSATLARERTLEQVVGIIDLNAKFGDQVNKMSEVELASKRLEIMLERLRGRYPEVSKEVKSMADRMEMLRATIDDVQLMIGSVLVRAGALGAAALSALAMSCYVVDEGFAKLIGGALHTAQALGIQTEAVQKLTAWMNKHAQESQKNREDSTRQMEKYWALVTASSEEIAKGAGKIDDGNQNALNSAKDLAEEYAKLKAALEKEIALVGLDGFEKKLKDLELSMPEFIKKFGEKKAKVIFELSLELINKEEIQTQLQALMQSYMSDEEKIIAKAKESAQQQDDAREWLADRRNQLTLSEFDYERATLLKEYEERAKVIGWTEELYNTFKDHLKKLDDKEVENKKETLRQIRDLELQNQLAVIDIKEKTFQISEGEAVQQKLDAQNESLQKYNEEYLAIVGIDAKREEGLKLLAKIRDIQKEIVDLQLRQEELTGSIADGWKRGLQEFAKEMPTTFQQGVDLAKTALGGLQDTLSNMSFDALKGKFKGWGDYVTSLCDIITKKMLDMMAQWLLFGEGGKGGLGGLFGLLGIGGAPQPQFESTPGGKIPQYDLTQETEAGSGIFATVFKDAGKEEEARQGGFLDGIKGIFDGVLGGFGGLFKDLLGGLGSLIGSIASGIGDLIGGLFHQGGLVMHSGGMIPATAGIQKYYIPRFHFGGLNDDERMTINKVGERYITQEQNSWLTNLGNAVKNATEMNRQDNRSLNIDMRGMVVDAGIDGNKKLISELRNNIEEVIVKTVRKHC